MSAVLQRAMLFLLLPFFTRVLTPTEFGQVGIITTVASLATVLLGLGLETAAFRGYLEHTHRGADADRYLTSVAAFGMCMPIVLGMLFALLAAPAAAPVLGVPVEALRLAAAGAGTAAAALVPLAILRSQERLADYLRLTALQVAVTPATTVLFVAILDLGPTGWMAAYALSNLILLVRAVISLDHRWSPYFDSSAIRKALAFGIPLVPHAAAHWGLSVSDRAILGAMIGPSAVSAYFAAYVLSLPVSLIAIAVSQATHPVYVEAASSPTRLVQVGRFAGAHAVIVALTAATVALIGPPMLVALLPPEYAYGAVLLPWLALGACLFGLYSIPVAAAALISGKTRYIWVVTVGAAGLNIGLNFWLIPLLGTLAAAINTTIGYGALLIGMSLYVRHSCKPRLPLETTRVAVALATIAVPSLAAAMWTDVSLGSLAVRGSVILLAATIVILGIFRQEAWAILRPLWLRAVRHE